MKSRSKSTNHKNSDSKQLKFIREVNEEFENMMAEAEGESLYGTGSSNLFAMNNSGLKHRPKKPSVMQKLLNIDPIVRGGISSAKAAEECL